MKKKTSLKDIAQKVGVSTTLVSYVLNNQKEGRISKEVAHKIREAAQELQYSPNQLAKSLRTRKTHTLGLIVADISNPFFSSLARILEDEAAKKGFTLLFGSSDERADKSGKLMQVLLDRQVDGLILAASEHSEEQVRLLQERQVPFVLIDRYFPDIAANSVAIDNFQAAQHAVQHLLEQGYERIGFISFASSLHHLQERKRGYRTALEQHKGSASPNAWVQEVSHNHQPEAVEKAIDALLALPEPVDALLFASNTLSVIGLQHLNGLSIRVPQELGIVSFDESEASSLFYAPLTHIRQPLKELGTQALQLLLHNLANKAAAKSILLEAQLVIGKSTLRTQHP